MSRSYAERNPIAFAAARTGANFRFDEDPGAIGKRYDVSREFIGKPVPNSYDGRVKLTIELDREDDGRWIAEALELPGVMCYGQTRDEAISNAERLAIEVIAERIAHGEMASAALAVSFSIPDEQLASH
jgi:predicted RNase H-like HicB family nuclease